MKKFSKLFARRLGRGSPTDTDYHKGLTRETSPDVHQLSRRRTGLQANARTAPRSGLSLIVADESHQPCDICKTIDFPKLLDWRPGQPRPWIKLSHTLADSDCPFCTFFQAMIGPVDGTDTFTPYLRIRLAFERLGVSEKHVLGKCVLVEISTKTKSLPWGYIVKAVDAEASASAGHGRDANGNPTDHESSGDDSKGGSEGDSEVKTRLNGHTDTDSDSEPSAIRGRLITRLLDPALARSWLDYCMTNHADESCAHRCDLPPGLRLIDCEQRQVVPAHDLEQSEEVDYLTLSYVRGEITAQSSDNWTSFPDDPPQLFADAVHMTKALGFRYLWIDRYCLPSPTREPDEHRRQWELIGDILQRSALTLIIGPGESVREGVPGISVPREEQLSLRTEAGLFTTSLLRPDLEIGDSKWASTGLSYQEGLFSRRRLVFTHSQVYFQCNTFHCHESISLPLHYAQDLNLGRAFPDAASVPIQSGHYKTHVGQYMFKDFVSEADRLDAFGGVLHRYSKLDHAVDNLLGLPLFHAEDFGPAKMVSQTDRLAVSLGWMPDKGIPSEGYIDPLEYQDKGPSWTWVSWRPRGEQTPTNNTFHFNLVEEASPIAEDVCAPPSTEISIGLDDESVLSWQLEGDAIMKASARIRFLRLKTFCVSIRVRKDDTSLTIMDSPFNKNTTSMVGAWYRSTNPDLVPDGEHELIVALVSGRHWSGDVKGAATFLVCKRRDWKPDDHLVRLGVLSTTFQELVHEDENNKEKAIMKGVEGDPPEEEKAGKMNGNGKNKDHDKKKTNTPSTTTNNNNGNDNNDITKKTQESKDVQLHLREIDIY